MSEDDVRLEPCPFCKRSGQKLVERGGIAVSLVAPRQRYGCLLCQISFPTAKQWNTRAIESRHSPTEVEAAARALVAKLDECEPHMADAFLHREMRAGPYTGPQYGTELTALRAALSASPPAGVVEALKSAREQVEKARNGYEQLRRTADAVDAAHTLKLIDTALAAMQGDKP